jgi:hypothetical protein
MKFQSFGMVYYTFIIQYLTHKSRLGGSWYDMYQVGRLSTCLGFKSMADW